MTVQRLELMAAILGLRLTQNVFRALEMSIQMLRFIPMAPMFCGGFMDTIETSDRLWPTVSVRYKCIVI